MIRFQATQPIGIGSPTVKKENLMQGDIAKNDQI